MNHPVYKVPGLNYEETKTENTYTTAAGTLTQYTYM